MKKGCARGVLRVGGDNNNLGQRKTYLRTLDTYENKLAGRSSDPGPWRRLMVYRVSHQIPLLGFVQLFGDRRLVEGRRIH
jgi:hypothetical protein